MKQIINSIIFASIVLILSACVKEDFDITPKKKYTFDVESNTSIAELKAMYTESGIIENDIIIKGTVISDDEQGNFYEKIVLQDSTGGIEIQINVSGLYSKYPSGSMVYVKCKGLVISDYRGVKQLTYLSNGSSVKLPEGVLDDYLFRSNEGLPITPKILKISELSEEHINTLIKLENVQFVENELGSTYADPGADANRTLIDLGENTIIVRTSDYATFAYDTIPEGSGSIIAVYSVYSDDKQLYIRDIFEVNMNEDRFSANYLLNEGFDSDLGVFGSYSVIGSQVWEHDTYDNGCAKMNGYTSSAQENEDWLISPVIDLSNVSEAILTFTHAVGYLESWDNGTVQISTDYDGSSNPATNGTWSEITDFIKASSWTFVSSGNIYLSDYIGEQNVYIAFKYLSSTSDAMTWEIGSVKIITN